MLNPFRRPPRELLRQYKEGRRLMRHGDGADEWIGMSLARDAAHDLEARGFDTDGTKLKACPKCGVRGRSHLVVDPRTSDSFQIKAPSYYSCSERLVGKTEVEALVAHDAYHAGWGQPCGYVTPKACREYRRQAALTVEPLEEQHD